MSSEVVPSEYGLQFTLFPATARMGDLSVGQKFIYDGWGYGTATYGEEVEAA